MGRINSNADMDQFNVAGSKFGFTGMGLTRLTSSEYTLVNIGVDHSYSTDGFSPDLLKMLKEAVGSCTHPKNPRREFLLIRVFLFNHELTEVHGFMPATSINIDDYDAIVSSGGTALYDATYSAIEATLEYGKTLNAGEFMVNAINIIITDGKDEHSKFAGPKMIAEKIKATKSAEAVESILNILIGINDDNNRSYLENFKADAELDHYLPTGDVSAKVLLKVGNFISQSISSQSVALGTGGASQNISASI